MFFLSTLNEKCHVVKKKWILTIGTVIYSIQLINNEKTFPAYEGVTSKPGNVDICR